MDALCFFRRMTPEISVIVPVYQDWDKAAGLIARLGAQTLEASRFEVLLVDNGSTVQPSLVAVAPFRLLTCETPGAYAARNYGAAQARGRFLAFTDADCLPEPDWLAALLQALSGPDGETQIFAGAIDAVPASARPGPSEIFDLVKGIPQERYVRRGYGATANLALSAALFRSLGGFEANRFSGGDAAFCRNAARQGRPTIYLAAARVGHMARRSWAEISTKARRIKGGQLRAGTRRSQRLHALRTLVPPLRGVWIFMGARKHSLARRLVASLMLFRVWAVEVVELVRLAFGAASERR